MGFLTKTLQHHDRTEVWNEQKCPELSRVRSCVSIHDRWTCELNWNWMMSQFCLWCKTLRFSFETVRERSSSSESRFGSRHLGPGPKLSSLAYRYVSLWCILAPDLLARMAVKPGSQHMPGRLFLPRSPLMSTLMREVAPKGICEIWRHFPGVKRMNLYYKVVSKWRNSNVCNFLHIACIIPERCVQASCGTICTYVYVV